MSTGRAVILSVGLGLILLGAWVTGLAVWLAVWPWNMVGVTSGLITMALGGFNAGAALAADD